MSKVTPFIMMLAAAVWAGGGGLAAQEPTPRVSWRERMTQALGLSADQLNALAGGDHGGWREMKQELAAEREKLNAMLRDRSRADDEIRSQLAKVEELERRWNARRLEKMLRARKILTDQQMKRLLELHQPQHDCRPRP